MYNNSDYLRDKFFCRFGNLKTTKEEKDRMFRQFLYEEEMREMQERIQADSYMGGGEKTSSSVTTTTTSTTTTTTMAPLPINNPDAYIYASRIISEGGSINYTTALALDVLFNDLQNTLISGPSGQVTIYEVLEAFYPMLGQTAATQAINANNNSAYDLSLYGGWTFDSMGMKGNGINTVAYTGKDYISYTGNELYNTHFSIYGTLPLNAPAGGDLSIFNTISGQTVSIYLNKPGFDTGYNEYQFGTGTPSLPGLTSANFVTISADGFGTQYYYQNGDLDHTQTIPLSLNSSQSLYLGRAINSTSTNRYGWASFGGFIDGYDIGTYYQPIVNTFMTSIGRNTY